MFKTLRKSFLVAIAMLTSSLLADNYIEIGTGTVTTNLPVYSSWNYTWAGEIYPQSALGGAKSITKIAFNSATSATKTLTNQKLYLKNSPDVIFGHAGYEAPETNGYTKVFDGTLTINPGWNEITLSAPFSYNGTGSLIIFNESRWGQNYGPNFYGTITTTNNIKSCGNDVAFPSAQTGYLNPYPNALPNIRVYYTSTEPATPDGFLPATNSKKVKVDNTFSFNLGANTTTYDLYMSSDSAAVSGLNATARVITDHDALNGSNSYTPAANLASRTIYFWRAVAKNSSQSTAGPVLKFRTQQIISQFPHFEGFEAFDAPSFEGATPVSSTIDGNYPEEREWFYPTSPMVWQNSYTDSLNAHSGKRRAKADIFSSGQNMSHNLMTPRLYLPADHRIEYWWKNNTYGGKKTAGYDSCYFEVTSNGGTTWTTLAVHSPENVMNQYEKASIDLSAHTGSNVYLRWRFKTPPNWSDCKQFSLDDITIEPNPSGSVIELNTHELTFQNLAINGKCKMPVKVTNAGTSVLNITSATVSAPFSCNFVKSIQPGLSDTAWVNFTPTAAISYNTALTFNSNAISGSNSVALSATGVDLLATLAESFETTTATMIPTGFYKIKSPTDQFTDAGVQGGNSGYQSVNSLKMLVANDSVSPLILVTPGLKNFDTNKLSFKALNYTGSSPINLIVGLMDNPYDASSFTPVQTISLPLQYETSKITFDGTNTKPYIGFKFGHVKGAYVSLRIDNIVWESSAATVPDPATVVAPLNNAVDNILKPTLTWAATTGSPSGFKVYFGTSASNLTMVSDQTTTKYVITAPLNLSTDYYWKIVPYNTIGDAANCPLWTFRTMDDPTVTLNAYETWTESFDNLTQTPGNTAPLGWAIQNMNSQPMAASWDLMIPANPAEAFTPPNCMNVAPSFYSKDCWLITKPIHMLAGGTYSLSYWFKNAVALGGETEAMKVSIGKEPGSVLANQTAETMTTQINDHPNIFSGSYENGVTEINIAETGNYYLGFHAYSPEGTNFILFLDQVELTFYGTGIENTKVPAVTALMQNYPNPFNPETSINFTLNQQQQVMINVHNIKGELVKTLVQGNLQAGYHNISFNAIDLPSGLYFCKMQTPGYSKVIKMNLIK